MKIRLRLTIRTINPDNVSPPDAAPAGDKQRREETAAAPVVAEQRPETLLQLKDGSMYGLMQYWVAGRPAELHHRLRREERHPIRSHRLRQDRAAQFAARRPVRSSDQRALELTLTAPSEYFPASAVVEPPAQSPLLERVARS